MYPLPSAVSIHRHNNNEEAEGLKAKLNWIDRRNSGKDWAANHAEPPGAAWLHQTTSREEAVDGCYAAFTAA